MQAELMVLRVVHIVGGVFWVGAMTFNAFLLGPAMAAAGPAAGPVAVNLVKRKVTTVMPLSAILTMLAGLRLMMITSTGFSRDYFSQPNGMTYAVGAVFAILGFVVGMVVTRPAMMKVASLGAAAASDETTRERIGAELRSMQERARSSNMIVSALLLIAAACMAVARYL